MEKLRSPQELLDAASTYLKQLKSACGFDEMLQLWRSTSIPYTMENSDPYSTKYQEEVYSIYKMLTKCDYNPSNELTSNKQSEQDFDIGYPWISGNLGIVAEELAKPVQILRALHSSGKTGSNIIEFGCGWGNLALPLARARQNVSVVDIDEGFLKRLSRKAQNEGLRISSYCGEFLEVARSIEDKFDVVIFQSSFHHCIDFVELLNTIKLNVLKRNGIILFASEPISDEWKFPWGLRYDGESLWAIMCNNWLELGFNHDFFTEMLFNVGFFLEKVAGIDGYVGEAWQARPCEVGIDFDKWELPSEYNAAFHYPDEGVAGRFCLGKSRLPGLRVPQGRKYELTMVNYGAEAVQVSIGDAQQGKLGLQPGCVEVIRMPVAKEPLVIESTTFIPDQQNGNGDTRVLGASIKHVALI